MGGRTIDGEGIDLAKQGVACSGLSPEPVALLSAIILAKQQGADSRFWDGSESLVREV